MREYTYSKCLLNDNSTSCGNLELFIVLSQLLSKIDSLKCYVKPRSKNCNLNIIEYCVNVNNPISLCLFAQNIQLGLGKPKLSDHDEDDLLQERKNLKEKASIVAQCLERKEEKVRNHAKAHRSFISEDIGVGKTDLCQRPHKPLKKNKNKTNKTALELDKKLPSNVIQELNTVLQKNRALHDETSS